MPDDTEQLTTETVPPEATTAPGTESSPDAPDSDSTPDAFLIVARVLRPHGTEGELACEIITEFPQRFKRTTRVFLTPARGPARLEPKDGVEPKPFAISQARMVQHRGHPEIVLTVDGVTDRDSAEALRGWLVQVPESESWKLPRGRFYWHQIIGLRVVTTDGEDIGAVTDILETGANDVYVVKLDGQERLIPAIKQVVTEIAPERGEMVVSLIPGL